METGPEESLWRHTGPGIPDSRILELMAKELMNMEHQASAKGETFDTIMRELAAVEKDRCEQEERIKREIEEKGFLKRPAEDEGDAKANRITKQKKQKKERGDPKEERPLTHGAHGLARQDGSDLPIRGMHRLRT